ncbi:unnamed protein product [Menidia menidia]|uniref:(Atlantic silverside) hypothetical protein n=1 Tax=Menidia menidia TaxID=238744 RepID=A0A8S4B1A7_9TELE|nr:unnamed protein product [Menidia menidia]
MSEPKYREWILDTIDSLRSRKARPDLERICRMVRRRHGSEPDRTCAELEKLIQEQTVLKVNYKGSISYRNAAKVQRRSRKKDELSLATAAARRSAVEEASHSDLSNGDSAFGAVDQDDEDLETGSGGWTSHERYREEEEGGARRGGGGGEEKKVRVWRECVFSCICNVLSGRTALGTTVAAVKNGKQGKSCVGRKPSLHYRRQKALFEPQTRRFYGAVKRAALARKGAVGTRTCPITDSSRRVYLTVTRFDCKSLTQCKVKVDGNWGGCKGGGGGEAAGVGRGRTTALADTSMAMDTDSNPDEEGAEESQDGQDGASPGGGGGGGGAREDAPVHCGPERAASAPCSPSGPRPGPGPGPPCGPGSAPDCASLQKAGERPSSLPPSSPRALAHNDWAYDAAVCPVERQHPGMQKDKADLKPAVHSGTSSPCALNNMKKEDGGKAEDSSLLSDQLVPDYAARLDETRSASDGRSQTLPLPSDSCAFKKVDISLTTAEDVLVNGDKDDDFSVKKEKMSQNLLQWTVADVASYFSAAGFPEQAVAFRTQEIDGKSLLLMQRSDVLTGLSIRLGPALKIYERHVKVLQRTHFLEYEDI